MDRYLIVPGYNNSGRDHWQTHLEASLDGANRVEMTDWLTPRATDWIRSIEIAITSVLVESGVPPILIGHSLGCIAIAHVARRGTSPIRGALLVAPADVDRANCPEVLRNFAPLPTEAFEFPTTVVASDNDPHLALDRARVLAKAWGSTLEVVSRGGHLNTESGHGPWPRARVLLRDLVTRSRRPQLRRAG